MPPGSEFSETKRCSIVPNTSFLAAITHLETQKCALLLFLGLARQQSIKKVSVDMILEKAVMKISNISFAHTVLVQRSAPALMPVPMFVEKHVMLEIVFSARWSMNMNSRNITIKPK